MVYEAHRDVQNDIQKNNMIALPRDDSSFEFLPYEVPFRDRAVYDEVNKFRKRIVEANLIMPV